MSTASRIGFGFLGFVLGGGVGGGAGLLLGLGYTTLATTSSFEGYSGYVVGLWILIGVIVGAIGGAVFGARARNN
jgi:hypothetical protein